MNYKNIAKELLFNYIYKLLYRPLSIDKINYDEELFVKLNNIIPVNHSTFKVYKIIIDGRNYYFRQIKVHTTFKYFIKNILDDYYLFYQLDNKMIKNKTLLYKVLLSKKTLKKIFYMGKVYDKNSKIYNFFNTVDYNIFYINELKVVGDKNILNLFQFIWGEVLLYRLNLGVKNNCYETFNSNKEIATKKMASILGISNLIPNIKLVKLVIDDNIIKYGTLMDEVQGTSPLDIASDDKKNFSYNFINDCINLNILDAINCEKDHRPDNYLVLYKNGKINSLQSFDNDSPASFGFSSNINLRSYYGSGPLINNYGLINYKQIDKCLFNNIMSVSKKDLYLLFDTELTFIQKKFLWKRLSKMKKVLIKSYNNGLQLINNKTKFIFSDNWNNNFTSYLDIFINFNNENNDFKIDNLLNK